MKQAVFLLIFAYAFFAEPSAHASNNPFEAFLGTYQVTSSSCFNGDASTQCPDSQIQVHTMPLFHDLFVNDIQLQEFNTTGAHNYQSAAVQGRAPDDATWHFVSKEAPNYFKDLEIDFTRDVNGQIVYDYSFIENDRRSSSYTSEKRHYTLQKIGH